MRTQLQQLAASKDNKIKNQQYILGYGLITLSISFLAIWSFFYNVVNLIRQDLQLTDKCYFFQSICNCIKWVMFYPSQFLFFVAINWLLIIITNISQYLYLRKITVYYVGLFFIGLIISTGMTILIIANWSKFWKQYGLLTLSFCAFSVILTISALAFLLQVRSAQQSLIGYASLQFFFRNMKRKLFGSIFLVFLTQIGIIYLFASIFLSLLELTNNDIPQFLVNLFLFICLLQGIWTMFLAGYIFRYYIIIETVTWIIYQQTNKLDARSKMSIIFRDIGALIVGSLFVPTLQYFSYGCYFVPYITKQLNLSNQIEQGADMFFQSQFFSKSLGCYTENNLYLVLIRNQDFWKAGQQLSWILIENIKRVGNIFKFSNALLAFGRIVISFLSAAIFSIVHPYFWENSQQISFFILMILGTIVVFQAGESFYCSFMCMFLTDLYKQKEVNQQYKIIEQYL